MAKKDKKISWFNIFIKIILIFITILIIVWTISKIINRNKLSDSFKNSINTMEIVAVKYFKTVDLPTIKGESKKVTLEEMENEGLIKNITGKNKTTCDNKNSYSKIIRKKDNYLVETYLECGEESNKITRKFNLKDCKNCNESISSNNSNSTEEENNITNNDNSNNDTTNTTDEQTTTYYEYVKETTSYSDWMTGYKTGNNIENKYEYYSIANKEYYSVGIIDENSIKNNKVEYTLKINTVPNKEYYYTKVTSSNYLDNNEINNYVNETNISMANGKKINLSNTKSYMLNENNFTYTLTPYYSKGIFYIKVKINIKSLTNTNKYYDQTTKSNIYLIPIKMNIRFDNGNVSNTKPNGEYEVISYYRYIEIDKEIKWSTEEYLEGYTKTGNTKVQ